MLGCDAHSFAELNQDINKLDETKQYLVKEVFSGFVSTNCTYNWCNWSKRP